jgi:hypothetical protein
MASSGFVFRMPLPSNQERTDSSRSGSWEEAERALEGVWASEWVLEREVDPDSWVRVAIINL